MTRKTYVYREGLGVIIKGAARFKDRHATRSIRSQLAAPSIIRDGLDGMFSHADGKQYDSKSAYYRTLKETGHRIIEAGERPRYTDNGPSKAEVGEAFCKVRDGYRPAPLETEDMTLD
jgi:hypothetical protein